MVIVCGTDFSSMSFTAVSAAAHIAHRLGAVLHLVHVIPTKLPEPQPSSTFWADELNRHVSRLEKMGIVVVAHIETGSPDEALLDVARELHASLIVVGAIGHRRSGPWQLGSHAERLAQRSHIPILIARDPTPFASWDRENTPLRVLVGVGSGPTSDAALTWTAGVNRAAPCDVIATHLYWASAQLARIGLSTPRNDPSGRAEIHRVLEREFRAHEKELGLTPGVAFQAEPQLGNTGDRLIAIAERNDAAVIVVGSRQRGHLQQLLERSVSHDVMAASKTSVVCVPIAHGAEQPMPEIDTVIAATDFSPAGDATVALACASVMTGGTVHVVHVVPRAVVRESYDVFAPESPEAETGPVAHMSTLVPFELGRRGVNVQTHVLTSNEPAAALCQAAERLGARMICIGEPKRTSIVELFVGSVSRELLKTSRLPILIARAPEPA